MRLSEAQRAALVIINSGSSQIRFQTGEALRRRGLAYRYTKTITRDVVVTVDGETEQLPPSHYPRESHVWRITEAGRAALREAQHDD